MKHFITKTEKGEVVVTFPVPPNYKQYQEDYLIVENLPVKDESEKYQMQGDSLLIVSKTVEDLEKELVQNNKKEIKKIDDLTRKEILKGFSYDGHMFSLSNNAQLNWQGLFMMNQSGIYTDQEISTIDNKPYTLTAEKVIPFFQAGSLALINELKKGRDQKQEL